MDTTAKDRVVVRGTASPGVATTSENKSTPAHALEVHTARKEHREDEVLPQGFRRPSADCREYPVQRRKGTPTLKEKGSLWGAAAQSDNAPARGTQRKRLGTRRTSQVEHYGSQPTRQDREPGRKEGNWVYPAWNAARECRP